MNAREGARVVEERRAAPRYDAASLGEAIVCRVNPGHEVELVNVSAVGACVEAAFALLPGRPLQLHVHGRGRRAAFEARVAWCRVAAVMSGRGVRFTAGLAFMRWVDLTKELLG
jgi:PilZ domain-containing protein